jgi:hypothetical protein
MSVYVKGKNVEDMHGFLSYIAQSQSLLYIITGRLQEKTSFDFTFFRGAGFDVMYFVSPFGLDIFAKRICFFFNLVNSGSQENWHPTTLFSRESDAMACYLESIHNPIYFEMHNKNVLINEIVYCD